MIIVPKEHNKNNQTLFLRSTIRLGANVETPYFRITGIFPYFQRNSENRKWNTENGIWITGHKMSVK